jgi:hypothetical protein
MGRLTGWIRKIFTFSKRLLLSGILRNNLVPEKAPRHFCCCARILVTLHLMHLVINFTTNQLFIVPDP